NEYYSKTVSLVQVATGMLLGWPSPMIPKLMAEDSTLRISRNEASWTVSLLKLGMAFGCLLSTFIVDHLGRKITILIAIVPAISSWSLIAWGSSITTLYAARIIGGIGSGMVFTAGSIYVTEIAPPHIRGALGSFFVMMDYCGSLLGYVIGSFTTMAEYAYAGMSLTTLQFLIFVWFPETPYYLLRRKRYAPAMDSLMFLRGTGGVSEEMDSIMRSVECEPRNTGVVSAILDLMSKAGGRRAILIGVCVMTLQAFSGSIILIAYTQPIFKKIHNVDSQETYMSIVLAVMQLITYCLCIGHVDRMGRKPLMIISVVGVVISSFLLGVYFCMLENNIDVDSLNWLAFTAILVYAVSVSLGLTSVPFVIMNEVFPMYAKATCIGLCFCLNLLWSFVLVWICSVVAFEHSMYVAFWIISALNALGIIFLTIYLPETKRMSLSRIEERIVRKKM
ncbi:Facilitated trehalose transporter Tret1, partial [Dufourea novaeangliae]